MKTLHLHMGFHKTGTTSFQRLCFDNRALLDKQNILYPLLKNHHKSNLTLINQSVAVRTAFASNPEKYPGGLGKIISQSFALRSDYYHDFVHALDTEKDLILSGEDISALDDEDLAELRLKIQSFGFDIKGVVLVRSPYSFHCSVMQECINHGGIFFNLRKKGIDSRSAYVSKLQKVFGNQVKFYPFSEAKSHMDGPAGFLAGKMQVVLENTNVLTAHSNKGANNLRTRVNNILNRGIDGLVLSSDEKHTLLDSLDDGKPFLLSKDELEPKMKNFLAENESLNCLLGPEFCDDKYPTIHREDAKMARKILRKIVNSSR